MAVAVHEAPPTDVDEVIGSVLAAYVAQREPASEMPLVEFTHAPAAVAAVRAVVASSVRAVEVALDDDADAAALAPVVWDLATRGWGATVLAPLDRLGALHGDLRGTPCVLQGWWRTDTGLSFTGREAP